ncbi:hypothetical protein GIB67_030297 [Kingdonia uniflora]|uniref:Germin-like protein n=1 Tax=Kingdonia uniflora TaxID=39325 RepID=A0A7J7M6J0_9MAGN|nr:hypothetical protein GIB67_034633 [Kingdonia uniflora]KAF6150493.1 hypothetical protein GIB67_030294 [Kingdonia uniflora]KAF6150495.1 hypothetical protein GIB67_030296 [Kingdonia uniflora]KAF6150496.1 hypothetical protein GIB67_030297 [Kingdonia uniflora]
MASPVLPLSLLLLFAILSNTFADPVPLQDTCVADLSSGVTINGFVCKPSNKVTADDFFFDGLKNPGRITSPLGTAVTPAFVLSIPGLNTLGASQARVDFAPGGSNPPHIHPRATEMIYILEGELEVGFITTANVLITRTITLGETFVFPKGLVHFQINNGVKNAAMLVSFNSQLPGIQSIAFTLFTASPPVPDNVLAKAFQIGTEEVDNIKSRLASTADNVI